MDLFLPTLPHWQFGNHWSGSCRNLRFWITPSDGALVAEAWQEDVCRELAQVIHSEQFPVSEEGIEQLRSWLLQFI